MLVHDVRAEFKLGGGKEVEHRYETAARLEERGGRADLAARGHPMRRVSIT
ncbi:hypothetical protein NE235_33290 [Actinoallomurus spadix]|uniref:Uncharacterized protein n=1 Tax=Actinoallomurus spadix TaxID=79912 RepID=A0ABN0X8P2_9ACTN|nr:hypothetical protein [Actinoallomurus spadix]MCO5990998.1 hypothetical protein [Actinoallomurus spadix]